MGRGETRRPTPLDEALAGEVRAEAARRGWSRADLEARSGIKRSRLRDVVFAPRYSLLVSELEGLALAFVIPAADLVRRAEESVGRPSLRLVAKDTDEPAREDPE